jgi:hypothetical protein
MNFGALMTGSFTIHYSSLFLSGASSRTGCVLASIAIVLPASILFSCLLFSPFVFVVRPLTLSTVLLLFSFPNRDEPAQVPSDPEDKQDEGETSSGDGESGTESDGEQDDGEGPGYPRREKSPNREQNEEEEENNNHEKDKEKNNDNGKVVHNSAEPHSSRPNVSEKSPGHDQGERAVVEEAVVETALAVNKPAEETAKMAAEVIAQPVFPHSVGERKHEERSDGGEMQDEEDNNSGAADRGGVGANAAVTEKSHWEELSMMRRLQELAELGCNGMIMHFELSSHPTNALHIYLRPVLVPLSFLSSSSYLPILHHQHTPHFRSKSEI